MPATSLTKVLGGTFGDGISDMGFEAADAANNNDFVNTGKERLYVNNGSGGAITVTFPNVPAGPRTINDVLTKTPTSTSIAAAKQARYGPFPVAIYGDTVEIAYSSGVTVTVAVVQDEDTPL